MVTVIASSQCKFTKKILKAKPRVKLVNPVKNEIRCISKIILDKINGATKSKLSLINGKSQNMLFTCL